MKKQFRSSRCPFTGALCYQDRTSCSTCDKRIRSGQKLLFECATEEPSVETKAAADNNCCLLEVPKLVDSFVETYGHSPSLEELKVFAQYLQFVGVNKT